MPFIQVSHRTEDNADSHSRICLRCEEKFMKKRQITAVVIGAGQRGGDVYAAYALAHPKELKIVGVAEPLADRRNELAKKHGIMPEACLSLDRKSVV